MSKKKRYHHEIKLRKGMQNSPKHLPEILTMGNTNPIIRGDVDNSCSRSDTRCVTQDKTNFCYFHH